MKKLAGLVLAWLLASHSGSCQFVCDTLTFNSSGSNVQGFFYSSGKENAHTLVFTQGFMESGDIWDLGSSLSQEGINVFMFDFRGCFKSEGKQGLMNSQQDLHAALGFLRSHEIIDRYKIDTSRLVLGGYSYGGHMSLLYAIYHPEIKRVISISGGDLVTFSDMILKNPGMRSSYLQFFNSIRKPDGPVDFAYEDPLEELVENLDYFNINDQIQKLESVDIFLSGGLEDNVVTVENYVLPMYRKLRENQSLAVTCKLYQCGHSYRNAEAQLRFDLEAFIRKVK